VIVVTGQIVVEAQEESVPAPVGSLPKPSLADTVRELRLQLGLPDELNVAQVIERACTEMGVATEAGMPLIEKANRCRVVLVGS